MAEAAIVNPAHGSALLPREISDLIFEDAREDSAVMRTVRRITLTEAGKSIPYISGVPQASWVSEGGRKPVSDATLGTKTMDPEKLAVIVPFSQEYLRSDSVNLLDELRPAIAEAFAVAFDAAAIHGTNTPFDNYIDETTNTVELGTGASYYVDLVAAMGLVVGDGYKLTGWLGAPELEVALLGNVDSEGRPILTTVGEAQIANRLVGRPIAWGDAVDSGTTLGFGGDMTKAAWGAVGEIEYDISTEATLTLTDASTLNLWQDNLVALRAEAWYGWAMRDVEAFVSLTDAA